MTVEQIRALNPARILLSPGPGRPEAAGVLMDVVRTLGREIPMLGVCLGHQAICAAFGATITYARKLMHGKQSMVTLDPDCPLFRGCPAVVPVARYHSPGRRPGHPARLPAHHRRHRRRRGDGGTAPQYPIFGVQFHPESILTPDGATMLRNFICCEEM